MSGLLTILAREVKRIALSALAGLLVAVLYFSLATPIYTAGTSMFIDPRHRRVVGDEVVQGGLGTDLALIDTQLALLLSDAVLRRVVERLQLANDPEFAPPPSTGLRATVRRALLGDRPVPDPTLQAIDSLAQKIRIKRAQRTYVIDIDVLSASPSKAAEIANAITEAYLTDQTRTKSSEARRANSLIDARLDELKRKVRSAEDAIDAFKRGNNIVTSEGGLVDEQRLTRLNGELVVARGAVAEAKARLDQLQALQRSGTSAESLGEAIRSNVIQRLREQHAAVARREASLATQLLPRHPQLVEVRSQLAEIRSQIRSELQRIVRATRTEHEVAVGRERELVLALERAKGEVAGTQTSQIQLRELEREFEASRMLLAAFLTRAKETAEQQSLVTPEARVITPASVPSRPSRPIGWLVIGLGLLAGLTIGVVLALVSDHSNRSLGREARRETSRHPAPHSSTRPTSGRASTGLETAGSTDAARPDPEQAAAASVTPGAVGVSRAFSHEVAFEPRRSGSQVPSVAAHEISDELTLLATLPRYRSGFADRWRGGGVRGPVDLATLMSEVARGGAKGSYADAVHDLLERVAPAKPRRAGASDVVLFASGNVGAGTTATATSFAYSAALAGRRVLLVDGDSGEATLSLAFAGGIEQERPCVIDNKQHLADLVTVDRGSGLAFLPLALMDLDRFSPRDRTRLAAGIGALACDYDLVVVDAGPLLERDGATALLDVCDSIVLVGRQNSSSLADGGTLAKLGTARRKLVGRVVTPG